MMSKDCDLSIKEAAADAGVHRNTIRRWIDEHGLEAEKSGPKKTTIKKSELDRFKKQFQEK